MLTFRYRGHGGGPSQPGNVERRVADADPVAKARARILASAILSERDLKALEKDVRETISSAALAARSELPPEASALHSALEA
jgi:pyruvate dehydrogenase E1 component alpha subunit